MTVSEQRIEALGSNLLAYHGDYHVNDDGWTVCICGHVAEGDDDDGSHARHVAKEVLGSAWFMESLASVWTEADAALRERLFNSYSHGDERGEPWVPWLGQLLRSLRDQPIANPYTR